MRGGRGDILGRIGDCAAIEFTVRTPVPGCEITVHGARIATEAGPLAVLHTPGHFSGHLSLALGDAVFTGDHVMGWASSLVSPPDGDLTAFMESCARLAAREGDRVYYPGHGAPVSDPHARLEWLVAHRRAREAAILSALGPLPRIAEALTAEPDIARSPFRPNHVVRSVAEIDLD